MSQKRRLPGGDAADDSAFDAAAAAAANGILPPLCRLERFVVVGVDRCLLLLAVLVVCKEFLFTKDKDNVCLKREDETRRIAVRYEWKNAARLVAATAAVVEPPSSGMVEHHQDEVKLLRESRQVAHLHTVVVMTSCFLKNTSLFLKKRRACSTAQRSPTRGQVDDSSGNYVGTAIK